jgi:hypothetical protein
VAVVRTRACNPRPGFVLLVVVVVTLSFWVLGSVRSVRRDGDKESSTVPFPESYFRIDPRKIITSLPTPASSAKPPSVPALDSPPSSTSQE